MKAFKVSVAVTVAAIAVLGMNGKVVAGGMDEFRALSQADQDLVQAQFWNGLKRDVAAISPDLGRVISTTGEGQERFVRSSWDFTISTCEALESLENVGQQNYKLSVSPKDTDRVVSAIAFNAVQSICPSHQDLFDYQWRQARHDDLD